MNLSNKPEEDKELEEILFWCSRCGGKYLPLGRVLKYGKHYKTYTVKHSDGTERTIPAHTEVKEALCRECAKEYYDQQSIKEARHQVLEEVREWAKEKRPRKSQEESFRRRDKATEWGYDVALNDLLTYLNNK